MRTVLLSHVSGDPLAFDPPRDEKADEHHSDACRKHDPVRIQAQPHQCSSVMEAKLAWINKVYLCGLCLYSTLASEISRFEKILKSEGGEIRDRQTCKQ